VRKVLVPGGAGFLGKHLVYQLKDRGYRVFVADRETDLNHVERPDVVINLAGFVGGIEFNRSRPVDLFLQNFMPGMKLLEFAKHWKSKFIQIGSVCEYPKLTQVPFLEDHLWNGYPEETNAPYGIAKRSLGVLGNAYANQYGLDYTHIILSNLYGPGDDFSDSGHVIPGMIRKFSDAKDSVTLWGTGKATREFLYVEDAADGIISMMERYTGTDPVNLGSGEEIYISNLAWKIARLMGYSGEIRWDHEKPNGQPRRAVDTSKASAYGWCANTSLDSGLSKTIKSFKESLANA